MVVRGDLSQRLEHTIEKLEINEEGFTVPWALSFEAREDGRCDAYLYVKYTISKIPGGTANLYVKRIGHGRADFEVDLESVGDYKYKLGRPDYIGADDEDLVCVGQVDMF